MPEKRQEEPRDSRTSGRRDVPLEAVRGAAAVVVVLYHGLMAFLPEHCGYFQEMLAPDAMALSPLFGLLNGSAAVTVFFVLSGYVLTLGVFRSGDVRRAVSSSVRRYPRLMGPVLASVLLSWMLLRLGLSGTDAAAKLSGSPWLATFGEAEPWPFDLGIGHALAEGTWRTLLLGEHDLNPALWTMRSELFGSLAALSAAAATVSRRLPARSGFVLLAVAFSATLELGAALAFAAGTGMAFAMAGGFPKIQDAAGGILVAGAVALLAVNDANGVPESVLALMPLDAGMAKAACHVAAGAILVFVAQACAPAARMLSGWAFARLGAVSFPLYLVHVPVMFSLGAWVYAEAYGIVPREVAAAAATAASLAASLLVALPLARLDVSWVEFLRDRFRGFAGRGVRGRALQAGP